MSYFKYAPISNQTPGDNNTFVVLFYLKASAKLDSNSGYDIKSESMYICEPADDDTRKDGCITGIIITIFIVYEYVLCRSLKKIINMKKVRIILSET